jgi:hypothetical protein
LEFWVRQRFLGAQKFVRKGKLKKHFYPSKDTRYAQSMYLSSFLGVQPTTDLLQLKKAGNLTENEQNMWRDISGKMIYIDHVHTKRHLAIIHQNNEI